jgi:hypothetical protein
MEPAQRLARSAAGALRLGRGLADRAIRITGPRIAQAAGRVAGSRPVLRRTTRESSPTTFTPSKREPAPSAPASGAGHVTPGSVAGNIAKQRPTARGASNNGPTRKSGPGAKLPPRRPSTTA